MSLSVSVFDVFVSLWSIWKREKVVVETNGNINIMAVMADNHKHKKQKNSVEH